MRVRMILAAWLAAGLAGCTQTSTVDAPDGKKKEAVKDPPVEVRFVVLVKPKELEAFNGEQKEPTVVLYWKPRSHWAKGIDPEVLLRTSVEPADRGVRAILKKSTTPPPDAKMEGEQVIPLTISVGETAPPGEYTITISGQVPGADPRKATIKIRVPMRD